MGFTENITAEVTAWVNGDDNNTANISPEDVLKFLNNTTDLCTPGFILRREIKRLVNEKKINLDIPVEKLPTETNEPLDDNIINPLANTLAKTFAKYEIHPNQWKSYLTDESFCNRETAIKIIFAFNMNNDETLAKFLLASGLNLFSVRNPFDYICLFCRKCGYSYFDVLTTFKNFETELKNSPNAAAKKPNPSEEMTRTLKNETEKIFANGKIKSPVDKLKQLTDFMVKHRGEFSTKNKDGKYNSGFSLQKIKMLNLFTKYLVMLYPTYDNFKTEKTREVRTNLDGEPKIYGQFVRAIHQVYDFDALSWNFSDYEEDGVSTRKVANVAYKIPFNNSVILPLKNMSKILRAMLRSPKDSDNYQDLDRNTILLFTYFFIEGYRCALRAKKPPAELAIEKLEQTIAATKDDDKKKFLIALKEIVYKIYDLEKPLPIANPPKPLDICIDAIKQMLLCFDFTSCYLPFLLDRFVLLCLLKNPVDQNGVHQYLLESVLKEAAEQTEEEISSKIMEAHNEQKQSR